MSKRWIIAGLAIASVFWSYSDRVVQGENLPVFTEPDSAFSESLTQPHQQLEFPFVLRNTGLIAECMAEYEGPFLEDDVQEPVSGAVALMVYNPGEQYVESIQIIVQCSEKTLRFSLSYLPPHSRVLVIEESGQPYSEEPVTQCRWDSLKLLQQRQCEEVCVKEESGKLVVSNRTGQDCAAVVLYYKQYSSEEDFYIGGKVYSQRLEKLNAGEEREILPYRYAPGYSRIVAILCENEKCASNLDAHFVLY